MSTVAELEDEVVHLKRMLWLLVKASGGRVSVDRGTLEGFNPGRATLVTGYSPSSGCYTFEAVDDEVGAEQGQLCHPQADL